MIEERILEVRNYEGEGFRPQIYFGSWRVAFLNYLECLHPCNIEKVERHPETDEVFILLHGKAILFLMDGEENTNILLSQILDPGVIYNVKPQTWHTVILSWNASILIVENANTGENNTEFLALSPEQRDTIIKMSRQEQLVFRK
jgi:ureidoglycolate hydrolase